MIDKLSKKGPPDFEMKQKVKKRAIMQIGCRLVGSDVNREVEEWARLQTEG